MDKRAKDKLVRSPRENGGGQDAQKDVHSRTGRDEKKGKTQEKTERGSRKRFSSAGSEKMERVGGRQEKIEGHCQTDQSPQWAVVPMEEEEGIDDYVFMWRVEEDKMTRYVRTQQCLRSYDTMYSVVTVKNVYLSYWYPREFTAEHCSTYPDVPVPLKSYMRRGANVGIVDYNLLRRIKRQRNIN